MEYLFYFFTFIIFYVYIGYPLVLIITSFNSRHVKRGEITPSVTLFIPAYNEARVIKEKIENSIAQDYPRHKLEIIVASDESTDGTGDIARNFKDKGVIFFEAEKRKGKNSLINEYISKCSGEIIGFTDANSFFKADAIKKLVRNFEDETVGCVVGKLKYIDKRTGVGRGEGLYFRYESLLKELESRHGTLVAATGSIYAIRKSLFTRLDSDVANDFAHPIQIAAQGYQIMFEPEAIAYEKATSSAGDEFKRRARIVTRGVTAFMRYWRPYHMLKGMWGFCFVSHKLLRWFIPVFLITIFLINLFLDSPFFKFTLYSQIGFYSIAFIGVFLKGKLGKVFAVPFYFCVINSAALIGVVRYFAGKRQSMWEVAKTTR